MHISDTNRASNGKEPPQTGDEWLAATALRTTNNWRIFRIMAEFVEGWHFLSDYPRTITIFGSARLKPQNKWYREAARLAKLFALDGYHIITGGGPGIMEAANRGAVSARNGGKRRGAAVGESIGLDIQLPLEQRKNRFVTRGRGFHYFFVRKVMLSYHAAAYAFFPGGYGTLDEVFEILTLIQTDKIEPVPVVLVGKEFWLPLVEWMRRDLGGRYKTISRNDFKIFSVVDNADEAYATVNAWYGTGT